MGHQQLAGENKILGFWVYLMTDLIMFACLFAAYAVLKNNAFGGPSAKELFSLPFALGETFILLTSSFTCGLALLAANKNNKTAVLMWLKITFLLGTAFVAMEFNEFHHLLAEGHSWQTSAFLSSFFSLVGTHGLHILSGLLWLGVINAFIYKKGLTEKVKNNLARFGMFWHFLDLVWIFIFTIVYLLK